MQWEGDLQRQRWRWRQRMVLVVVAVSLISSVLAIALHYYFSRSMALSSAEARYELAATTTRDYLSGIDNRASQIVRILARHPNLMEQQWVHPATAELFAEVMRSNPVFYAIYIGFGNGDFYELVNLNTSDDVRLQLQAMPSDRWVEIVVQGEGAKRERRFTYLNEQLQVNYSRSERSDYDATQRLWFTNAGRDQVYKTRPYLFQHLQAPGQSFSLQIPASQAAAERPAVLTVDVAFSALSDQLRSQPLSLDGELFLFQRSGELLASNHATVQQRALPKPPPLALSEAQQAYIKSLGKIRVANEPDWAPIDFAIAGEPKGYSIDLLRLLAGMTGLELEFINGYRWPELVQLFNKGELEILQPVIATDENRARGIFTDAWLTLDYALVTRKDTAAPANLEDLYPRVLVMPEGWSLNAVLKQRYPNLAVRIVDSTRTALEMVANGQAFATLDSETILRRTAGQFFLRDLVFHSEINGLQALPATVHFQLRQDLQPLADILNSAIAALPGNVLAQLQERWLHDSELPRDIALSVVPYPAVLDMVARGNGRAMVPQGESGEHYYFFVSSLSRISDREEYFAFVVTEQRLFTSALRDVQRSAFIIGLFWLLLMPVILLFLLRPLRTVNSDPA
ncbi:transporter substrate-binding domain-containing protein [Venatoribacter cucullus]|uniref:transporter substrate-binding domain-containing protein n=1 Tax=Venatoribacter cucullus TaxID=2661630 RepID=UPI00223F4DBE|nr:transporter substrate-binding domain-containing protein [Venatoribacter cucullus]UZK04207.1 transporter substrate-binding domain-containing protein [Venatoribacter cucullus]